MNKWSQDLGLDTSKWSFQDCYGLDPEVLSWVSKPVKVSVGFWGRKEAVLGSCSFSLSPEILGTVDGKDDF